MNDSKRPTWKPFSDYLERLTKQREQRGEPPPPDCAPPEYWIERAKQRDEATNNKGLNRDDARRYLKRQKEYVAKLQ
jgi:hypothetical protein